MLLFTGGKGLIRIEYEIVPSLEKAALALADFIDIPFIESVSLDNSEGRIEMEIFQPLCEYLIGRISKLDNVWLDLDSELVSYLLLQLF